MRLIHKIAGLAVIISVLGGCASPQKILARGTPVSKENGYVGGLFVQKKASDVTGFTLTNVDTKQEFEIPFVSGVEKFRSMSPEENWSTETNVIELPPGKYAVTHWFQFHITSHGRGSGHEFPSAVRNQTFQIEPGKLVFLGKFKGDIDVPLAIFSRTYTQSTRRLALTYGEARQVAGQAYPELRSLKFECLACTN